MEELTGWLGYVEPIATAAAAAVAIYAAYDAKRSAAQQRRETERQGHIALEAMLLEYHQAILAWSAECISWMAQAVSLTFFDPEKTTGESFFNRRAECIRHLSALLDQGRLFFPNQDHQSVGLHKPEAFRGFRPIVLDQLKFVHDYVTELYSAKRDIKSPADSRKEIVDCRRQFVTEVQRAVDPRARECRLKGMI